MQPYAMVEAARWHAQCQSIQNDSIERRAVRISTPSENHIRLLRILTSTYDLCNGTMLELSDILDREIKMREEVVGRAIDPGMPVEVSQGVTETVELIESTELKLAEMELRMEAAVDLAEFDIENVYEKRARAGINCVRNLLETTEIGMYAFLWIQWVFESVTQTQRILHNLQSRDGEGGMRKYPYLAHPPLIVSIIGGSVLIENVGALYLNKLTDADIPFEETRVSGVIRKLSQHCPDIEEFDTEAMREVLKEARDTLAHDLLNRGTIIDQEEIGRYTTTIFGTLRLVQQLLWNVVSHYTERFQEDVMVE